MRHRVAFAVIAAAIAGVALGAAAEDYTAGALTIVHPWARATAPRAPAGTVYFTVGNAGAADDRLVGVTVGAEIAGPATLHTSRMEGDVMQMLPVEGIDVPAGGSVTLAPGGDHVMLTGLAGPLVEGMRFPIALVFEAAGEVTVEVDVEGIGAMGPTP